MKKYLLIIGFVFLLAVLARADSIPPAAVFFPLAHDISTDSLPIITGIATDESSNINTIECRVDSGAWSTATATDGAIAGRIKLFAWTPARALARSFNQHLVEVRCFDAAGNFNLTYPSYAFYVLGNQPAIDLKSHGVPLANGDTLDKDPSFNITIISANPPVRLRRSITDSSIGIEDLGTVTVTADATKPNIFYGKYSPRLNDGTYILKLEAIDSGGNSSFLEYNELHVRSASEVQIQQPPLSYPNPFDPNSTPQYISIGYMLTRSSNISLSIYTVTMNRIARKDYPAESNGGKAGYNEISWNGRDNSGSLVGNGIYLFLIVADGNLLGKGKITILKR